MRDALVEPTYPIASLGQYKFLNNYTQLIKGAFNKVLNGQHVSDVLNSLIDSKDLESSQIMELISIIIRDKFQAYVLSFNLEENLSIRDAGTQTHFEKISKTLSAWNEFSIVCTCHSGEDGVRVINPYSMGSWQNAFPLRAHSCFSIYIFNTQEIKNEQVELFSQAAQNLASFIQGKKQPKELSHYSTFINSAKKSWDTQALSKNTSVRPTAQIQTATVAHKSPKDLTLSPKYSVQVTNELFHNGNVEAWKNIIESYTFIYPQSKVYIYYEDEKIFDINTLFQWGKVQNGRSIMFQVEGKEFKQLSILRKCFYEASSPRFEVFMKKDLSKPLSLF